MPDRYPTSHERPCTLSSLVRGTPQNRAMPPTQLDGRNWWWSWGGIIRTPLEHDEWGRRESNPHWRRFKRPASADWATSPLPRRLSADTWRPRGPRVTPVANLRCWPGRSLGTVVAYVGRDGTTRRGTHSDR